MLWQIRECCRFVQKEIERKSQQELKRLGFAKIDSSICVCRILGGSYGVLALQIFKSCKSTPFFQFEIGQSYRIEAANPSFFLISFQDFYPNGLFGSREKGRREKRRRENGII